MDILNNSFTLTVWETDPAKRNTNNIVQFVVSSLIHPSEGDRLIIAHPDQGNSVYELLEIIEAIPARLSGVTLITAKTKWYREAPVSQDNAFKETQHYFS